MPRTSIAEEAILLASDTNSACDYLRERGAKASFWDPILKPTEAALLQRNERLIDLTLAEFCLYPETARALFTCDPNDAPIRSLVLSNEAMGKGRLRFPGCLFDGEDGLLAYLRTVSSDERAQLFSNPSIDDIFLEQFLSMGQPWQEMDPEQRVWALHNLGHNERLRRERSMADFDDGWDWYTAGKPIAAAWQLIERLDVSSATVSALAALLRQLPNDCSETESIQASLDRWQPTTEEEQAKEKAENLKGRLSGYQEVRQAGARLIASDYNSDLTHFRESDDLAQRCGAYEIGRFKPKEMEAAVERDGDHARLYLVRNQQLWRSEKSRDALRDILGGAKSDDPGWEYGRNETHYRKSFPLWFKDEDLPAELDERPISGATIAEVASAVAQDPSILGITARLTALQKQQNVLLWMVLALLIVLFWRR